MNMISADAQQKILCLLGENGHRLTSQKRTVLRVLFTHDRDHMTVEEIYRYAKSQSPNISIATVYKAISFLEQTNVLHKIRTNDKCSCYELVHPGEPEGHPHCICTKCGKTFGIVDDSVMHMLSDCEQTIGSRYHFQIDLQNILYYGMCDKCRGDSKK
jgi:Fur family transcriptional regulator, ferric uptake regulator